VPDKPLEWIGTSRVDVRRFTAAARRLTGFQLRRVQQGLDPNDWKPMTTVGAGVREIRIHVDGAHRVFYVATFDEAVYVLHAFTKKTRKTAQRDIAIGRQRFGELAAMRKQRHDEAKQR
jgi:phage-related protein